VADRRWSASRLLFRRALWGFALPCLALCGLLVALVVGWGLVLPSDGGTTSSIVDHAWVCAALMLVGVFPMLAVVFLLEAWLRHLLVPEAIPNLGSPSGCLLTVVIGAILPLLATAGSLGAFHVARSLREAAANARASAQEAAPDPQSMPEPLAIDSFQEGDIIYSQLDRNGFATSITHFFREFGPDDDIPNKPFTINHSEADTGQIELYRLRNVGTGESFEFQNVPVKRLASGDWIITDQGQKQIRDQLQARMRVQIRRIGGY